MKNKLKYEIVGDHVVITECDETVKTVNIPEFIENLPVTEIETEAFYMCQALTSVRLPASITEIGGYEFYNCERLTEIQMAEENPFFKSVDGVVFSKDGKKLVYFPIFGPEKYRIPDGVMEIGEETFYYCSRLASLTIPEGVTKIGKEAFQACTALRSVTIPASLTEIKMPIWAKCVSLAEIQVAEENEVFKSVDGVLFSKNRKKLIRFGGEPTKYRVPDGVTEIGEYAFYGCKRLVSVTVPASVKKIGECAFSECDQLTEIVFFEGVEEIGDYAFSASDQLSVTIPASVTIIGDGAFTGYERQMKIQVSTENPNYKYVDGVLFTKDGKTLLKFMRDDLTDYQIPDGVTKIGMEAFWRCDNLQSVTFPKNLTEIGGSAFSLCKKLKTAMIPDGVTKIGEWAFSDCENLTSATIPASVKRIGDHAFLNCVNLTSATISEGVEEIGEYAFGACRKLTSLTIPESITLMEADIFKFSPNITLFGKKGTCTERYATENAILFIAKDDNQRKTNDSCN
ncbi:MAG: leucine-rich repeat domain-containing protein [Planctomycetia bacterium]|nr:leucine-rich repeat domain-containing protein [Planctomycetia bacterium]